MLLVPTMLDALATSKAPIIFSHSSAHAICNSSRNVPDHVLKRIVSFIVLWKCPHFILFSLHFSLLKAVNGGLVMVAFYPHFVSCGEKATLKDVIGKLKDFNSLISLELLLLHFIIVLVITWHMQLREGY